MHPLTTFVSLAPLLTIITALPVLLQARDVSTNDHRWHKIPTCWGKEIGIDVPVACKKAKLPPAGTSYMDDNRNQGLEGDVFQKQDGGQASTAGGNLEVENRQTEKPAPVSPRHAMRFKPHSREDFGEFEGSEGMPIASPRKGR